MSTRRSAPTTMPALRANTLQAPTEVEPSPPPSKRRKLYQVEIESTASPASSIHQSSKKQLKQISPDELEVAAPTNSPKKRSTGRPPLQKETQKKRDIYDFPDDDGSELDELVVQQSPSPPPPTIRTPRSTNRPATYARVKQRYGRKKTEKMPKVDLRLANGRMESPASAAKASRSVRGNPADLLENDSSSLTSSVKRSRGKLVRLGSEVSNSARDDQSSLRSLSPIKRGRPKKLGVAKEEEKEGESDEEETPNKRNKARADVGNGLAVPKRRGRPPNVVTGVNGERPKTAVRPLSTSSKLQGKSTPVTPGRPKIKVKTPLSGGTANSNGLVLGDVDKDDVFAPTKSSGGHGSAKMTQTLKNAAVQSSSGEESSEETGDLEIENVADSSKSKPLKTTKTKYAGKVTEDGIRTLKKHVLDKITGRSLPAKLVGLKEEYNNVHQLLEQTVTNGEGNSIILIGPRGSGKTAMTETAVTALQREHGKDFLVVRLNGLLQSDEKSAVKEIWWQLGSAMEIDEEKPINFADTFTSILALLSHPSELNNSQDVDQTEYSTTSVSVVFLISEFDLFAAHPRQTLLYNLFDIAQAKKAPIAVVGMTTRIDVVEMLEKRVKSRFSHRSVGVKIGGNLGSRLEGWWDVVRSALCVDEVAMKDADKADKAYLQEWNSRLDTMFKEDSTFRKIANSVYAKSKDVKTFLNHCIIPINELSAKQPFLEGGVVLLGNALVPPDNKLYLLAELPELSLSLLICAARLDPILETDTCNFTMAYDEYKTLVSRVKVASQSTWAMKVWGKEVALAAWEKLAEWELIVPATGNLSGGVSITAAVGGREARMFCVEVGLLEIKRQGREWGMSTIFNNWCSIG